MNNTFQNPVSSFSAPDPFMTYDPDTAYYYALFTRGNRVEIFRSRLAGSIISDGDSRVIYEPHAVDGIYGEIWAPEMHKGSNGRWYIYTSGRYTAEPGRKCLFILEACSDDPFGDWVFKCKPAPDLYAIDPTVYMSPEGKQYICYSKAGGGQCLEIRELENPYTFSNRAAVISCAEYSWEMVPPYAEKTINEGPFFVENKGRLFIIYSANGCWSDHYCLGVIEYTGGDICSPSSWKKHPKPMLTYGNGVYGPGHASFFYSPDKSEIWCAYHGMKEHNEESKPAPRYFHIQKMQFDEDGFPISTIPVGEGVDIVSPSGENQMCAEE